MSTRWCRRSAAICGKKNSYTRIVKAMLASAIGSDLRILRASSERKNGCCRKSVCNTVKPMPPISSKVASCSTVVALITLDGSQINRGAILIRDAAWLLLLILNPAQLDENVGKPRYRRKASVPDLRQPIA